MYWTTTVINRVLLGVPPVPSNLFPTKQEAMLFIHNVFFSPSFSLLQTWVKLHNSSTIEVAGWCYLSCTCYRFQRGHVLNSELLPSLTQMFSRTQKYLQI